MGLEEHPSFLKIVTDDHQYTLAQTANGTFNVNKISIDLRASGITQLPQTIGISSTSVTFRFSAPLSVPDKDRLNAVVASHTGNGTLLELAKRTKSLYVDQRTTGLIERGTFVYDTKQFSTSKTAQFNTHVMWTRRNESSFSYPVVRATKDNLSTTSLADATAVEAFYDASESAVRSILDAGNALKTQVNAATTVEEVNAVIDNR